MTLFVTLLLCLCFLSVVISYNPGTNWNNKYAFAGVKTNGEVVTWGLNGAGASITFNSYEVSGAVDIVSTDEAFAILLQDGSFRTIGDSSYGGSYPTFTTLESITYISANRYAFAALSSSGKVVSWRYYYASYDGNLAGIQSGVTKLFSNPYAFVDVE